MAILPVLLASCSASAPQGPPVDSGIATSAGSTAATGSDSAYDTVNLDLGGDDGTPPNACKVDPDDLDGMGGCDYQAPPEAFAVDVQWSWTGSEHPQSIVPALVANLTDDNADGAIDLCDIPDVVVVAYSIFDYGGAGRIYVLDGATGAQQFKFADDVHLGATPALADLDNDGDVEIIAVRPNPTASVVAFSADGTIEWEASEPSPEFPWGGVSVADLDADGTPEVIWGGDVFDSAGQLLWRGAVTGYGYSTAADLDDDGTLELIVGDAAFDHEGNPHWATNGLGGGFSHVADLDGDGRPEVLLTGSGLTLFEHDGAVVYLDLRPTGDPADKWNKPAAIHDIDGDGAVEYLTSSAGNYAAYSPAGVVLWQAAVQDQSGSAGSTAFDFLGDGTAEAIYADEVQLFVYDQTGDVLLNAARSSITGHEYPTVADVDNDGAAEILIVSNVGYDGLMPAPTVQLIRDAEDRWVPARRIWNQHTYHVTNVREDGTIPTVEAPHWKSLNTFRTQAQIAAGGVCNPNPAG